MMIWTTKFHPLLRMGPHRVRRIIVDPALDRDKTQIDNAIAAVGFPAGAGHRG
jgi:hypothetical protein